MPVFQGWLGASKADRSGPDRRVHRIGMTRSAHVSMSQNARARVLTGMHKAQLSQRDRLADHRSGRLPPLRSDRICRIERVVSLDAYALPGMTGQVRHPPRTPPHRLPTISSHYSISFGSTERRPALHKTTRDETMFSAVIMRFELAGIIDVSEVTGEDLRTRRYKMFRVRVVGAPHPSFLT